MCTTNFSTSARNRHVGLTLFCLLLATAFVTGSRLYANSHYRDRACALMWIPSCYACFGLSQTFLGHANTSLQFGAYLGILCGPFRHGWGPAQTICHPEHRVGHEAAVQHDRNRHQRCGSQSPRARRPCIAVMPVIASGAAWPRRRRSARPDVANAWPPLPRSDPR